jgi:hypothetical protein
MVISAHHLTVEGKMLADGRTQTMLGPSGNQGPMDAENAGVLYAPLLFKNYNGWSSGLVVTVMTTSGGQSSTATVSFYDEGGQYIGQLSDRLSRATMYVYLPAIEFLPDKFRGTAIIHVGCAGCDFPGFAPGFSASSMVNHVNYDRNTAMSYDGIGISAVVNRTEGVGELPCISIGFTTCAWAGDVVKTYTVSRDNVQIGPQTGIRIYNPDPQSFGTPATVVIHFIDDTGVIWNEATQVVTIPPFGVNTIFPMYDARLPEIFSGSVRISASGNYIVGIAQTVDYSASGVDAGGAYNLQYQSGRTR